MRILFPTLLALIVATTSGCLSHTRRPIAGVDAGEKAILKASRELDLVARDIDEYGTVSISSVQPFVVGDLFRFKLDKTPRELLADEEGRIHGVSAARNFEEFTLRLVAALRMLEVGGDADAATAELARAVLEAPEPEGEGSGEPGEGNEGQGESEGNGEGGGDGEGDDEEGEAEGEEDDSVDREFVRKNLLEPDAPDPYARADKFTPAFATLKERPELDVPLRDLIKTVFDDHMTIKLFEFLSYPAAGAQSSRQRIFGLAMTVSIRPGRRTYRGYLGEVDVSMGYRDEGLRPGGREHPLALAVFPAMDNQVLDLRTSSRRQFAMSLLVDAVLPRGRAGAAGQYVKRREHDAATITPQNTVVGYTSQGRHFGWRFAPAFVAQADPASPETGPDHMLRAQSFPAIVFVQMDEKGLCTLLGEELRDDDSTPPKSDDQSPQECCGCDDEQAVMKLTPHQNCLTTDATTAKRKPPKTPSAKSCYAWLDLDVTQRWLRAPSPASDIGWLRLPFRGEGNRLLNPRLKESYVAEWGLRLDRARKHYRCAHAELESARKRGESEGPDESYAMASLKKRINMLESVSVANSISLRIPDVAPPTVTAIAPTSINPDVSNQLLISGSGLRKLKSCESHTSDGADSLHVLVGGHRVAKIIHVDDDGRSALVSLPALANVTSEKMDVSVYVPCAGTAMLRDALAIKKKGSAPKSKGPDLTTKLKAKIDKSKPGKTEAEFELYGEKGVEFFKTLISGSAPAPSPAPGKAPAPAPAPAPGPAPQDKDKDKDRDKDKEKPQGETEAKKDADKQGEKDAQKNEPQKENSSGSDAGGRAATN